MFHRIVLMTLLAFGMVSFPAWATDMSVHLRVDGQPQVTAQPGDVLIVDVMLTANNPIESMQFGLTPQPPADYFIATSMVCHAAACVPVDPTPVILPTNGDSFQVMSFAPYLPELPNPAISITLEIVPYATAGSYQVLPLNLAAIDSSSASVNIVNIEPLDVQITTSPPLPGLGDFNWEILPVAPMHTYYNALAFLPSGQPAIAFTSNTDGNNKLTYAWLDGHFWRSMEVAAFTATHCSLQILPSGQPAISACGDSTGNSQLQYFWYDGAAWQEQIVDSDPNVGQWNSLAILPTGHPAISYYDSGNRDLKYASFDGLSWQSEVVATTGDVGEYTSLAVLPNGSPAISYFDATNQDLKYAWHDGSDWQTITVDSTGSVGSYSSLALLQDGHPAISYADNTNRVTKYAWFDGSNWSTRNIPWAGAQGIVGTSLAILPGGQPAIAFLSLDTEYGYDLHYATWDGAAWETADVDVIGAEGRHPSLAIGLDGMPAISFGDDNQSRICLARRVVWAPSPVAMVVDYTAYADTDYTSPVTTSNSLAQAEGTGAAMEPQWSRVISDQDTVPEGHLRTNVILQGRDGADWSTQCLESDPITGECLVWGQILFPAPVDGAEGSVSGTISIGASAEYPTGTTLYLTCDVVLRGTPALDAYELKLLRGVDTIALVDMASPRLQTVAVTAGEQLGFSVSGATGGTWGGYNIHVDGRFVLSDTRIMPPQIVSAVSRRLHGGNPFDLTVWPATDPVECRSSGPQQIVIAFDQAIAQVTGTGDDVVLSSGTLNSEDGLLVEGDTLTVNMSGAANGASLTVEFPGIAAASAAQATVQETLCLGVLAGDTTSDGLTNIFDLIAIRNQLNQAVNAATFRNDVTADGSINIFDLIATRNVLNQQVGPCPD